MDRREFLQNSVVATLAANVLRDDTLARAQTRPASGALPDVSPRRLIMDAYTRHLHWIRSADDIAKAAIEMTCGGVNPTIQDPPGHINPANVARELPLFVKTMQKHGLRVKQIRGGNQTDVTAPHVEAIVGTMGQLGVTHYWMGTDNYDLTKPILPQLDALKRKVDGFVKLNQKHGTTLMYHTRAGARSVGSVVWDLLYVLKDFDPKHVGFHWDTGHMSHHGSEMWELLMRTAGPYVVAIGWKDRSWERDPAVAAQGGSPTARTSPTPPTPTPATTPATTPAATAPTTPATTTPAAPATTGRRPGVGANLTTREGGWRSPYVPMGTGLVDIQRYAAVIRDIGFDGPMELEAEYPNGGSENGEAKLTLPPEQVIANLKRDVLTIRAAFEQSKTGLSL